MEKEHEPRTGAGRAALPLSAAAEAASRGSAVTLLVFAGLLVLVVLLSEIATLIASPDEGELDHLPRLRSSRCFSPTACAARIFARTFDSCAAADERM